MPSGPGLPLKKMFKKLRRRIEHIRWEDAANPSRWVKFARGQMRLYFYILRELVRNRCPQQAAALTFTTLLSLVPLLAVAFSFFRGFAAMDGLAEKAQTAIFETMLAGPLVRSVQSDEEELGPVQPAAGIAEAPPQELLAEADGRPRSREVARTVQLYLAALNADADAELVRQGLSTLHFRKTASGLRELLVTVGVRARQAYFAAAGLPPGVEQKPMGRSPEGVRYLERARALTDRGEYLDAVAALKLAEQSGHSVLTTRAAAGQAYEALADRLAAEGQLRKAVERRRTALASYCDAVLVAGLYGSDDQIGRAVERHSGALQKLGRGLFELGRREADLYGDLRGRSELTADETLRAAIGNLEEAIAVLEHSAEVHAVLAEVLYEAGQKDQARQEYKTAFEQSNEVAARGISLAVVDYIRIFIDKVGRAEIGVLGILFLVVGATFLLNTIERTLNHIWKVTEPRPFWIKFTSFCTLIWLGPALIGASILVRERLAVHIQATLGDVAVIGRAVGVVTALGEHVLPFLTIWLILVALYKFLPHTRVKFSSVAWGAFLAAVLLQGARPLFSLYVLKAVKYEKIYGSLGVVPIFLLWIWLQWLIVLFGAEVSFTIQNVGLLRYRDKLHRLSSIFIDRYLAARMMMYVAREFWDSGEPVSANRLAEILQIPPEEAADAAGRLVRLGLLTRVGEELGEFHPARDLSKLKLSEVLSITDRFRDESRSVQPEDKPYEDKLEAAFRSAIQAQREALEQLTFRDLLLECEKDRNKWPKRPPSQPG